MKSFKAEEFGNGWEYDKAKRKERKETKRGRAAKRGRKGIWEAKPSDE